MQGIVYEGNPGKGEMMICRFTSRNLGQTFVCVFFSIQSLRQDKLSFCRGKRRCFVQLSQHGNQHPDIEVTQKTGITELMDPWFQRHGKLIQEARWENSQRFLPSQTHGRAGRVI